MRTRRTRRVALCLGAIAAISGTCLAIACSDTGPGAPPRSNGCIGQACYGTPDATSPAPPPGTTDAATPTDGGAGFPDPLAGTTKQATLVKNGFGFTEGPVWIGGRLLFSDQQANTIFELESDGGIDPFRPDSGGANGNAVDANGRLVTCEGGNHRVTRSQPTAGAAINAIAGTFNGKAFNAPNDVISRNDGNVYFTDPNYSGSPDIQDAEAVYRIAPAGAGVTRLAHTFNKPNGIALSPDGNTLYVDDNGTGELFVAPLAADGSLTADFTKIATTPGCDGMAVDDAGNLYVSDTGGVDVFDKTGKSLGTITVPQQPANCTFGGTDRRTLFITARTALYSIVLNVPGLP